MPERPPLEIGTTVRKGAAFSAASHVAAAAASWLTGIAVARILGPDGAGDYGVALTLVLTLTALSGSGVATGIAYQASQLAWAPSDALRQIQLAAVGFGALGVCGGAIGVLLLRTSAFEGLSDEALALCLLAVPFALVWIYVTHLALAVEQLGLYAAGAPTHTVIALLLAVALAPAFGVEGAVMALAVSHLLAAIVVAAWGRARWGSPRPGWLGRAIAELKDAIRFGLKSYTYIALNFLNLRLDLLILAASAGSATVGRYAVAVSVTGLGSLLPRGLAGPVFARIAKLDALNQGEERDLLIGRAVRQAVMVVLVVSLVLAVLLAVIPLLYGSGFEGSIQLGLILLPGVGALGISAVLAAVVTGRGRPEYELYTAVLCTPIAVVAYLLIIPATGAYGAAAASTGAYVLTLFVSYFFFRRVTGMTRLRVFVPSRAELREWRTGISQLRIRPGA